MRDHCRFSALFLALCCTLATAENWPAGIPHLVGGSQEHPSPISLQAVDAEVRIQGFLAETTLTFTLHNGDNRQREGALLLPVREGTAVCGFAIDIGNRMADGVIVEKQKARISFERETRRSVDPGILEWVNDTLYRARIYPIGPEGTRKVMIRYLSPMDLENGTMSFRLPLAGYPELAKFSLSLNIDRHAKNHVVATHPFEELPTKKSFDGFYSKKSVDHFRPQKDLLVRIASPEGLKLMAELSTSGDVTFLVADKIQAAGTPQSQSPPRALGLYWDASHSRPGQNLDIELDALKSLLGLWRPERVHLIVFRDLSEEPITFSHGRSGWTALFRHLNGLAYDGGTDLSGLSQPVELDMDAALLFCDGLQNLGDRVLPEWQVPVYSFTASANANAGLLRKIAHSSGGRFLKLDAATAAEGPWQALLNPIFLTEITDGGARLERTAPELWFPVDGTLVVSGVAKPSPNGLELVFRQGTFSWSGHTASEAPPLPWPGWVERYRAFLELRDLTTFAETNASEILDLGRKHGLVTPETTLMVFETAQQYATYQVEPPKSMPAFRREYHGQTHEIAEVLELRKQVHRTKVRNDLKQRMEDFHRKDTVEPPQKSGNHQEFAHSGNGATRDDASTLGAENRPNLSLTVRTADITGEALPGTLITVSKNGVNRSSVCDTNGKCRFLNLPDGIYELRAVLAGFNTVIHSRIAIRGGHPIHLDLVLKPASQTEELVVTAETPTLDSRRGRRTAEEFGRIGFVSDLTFLEGVVGDFNSPNPEFEAGGELGTWDPERPYLAVLKDRAPDGRYSAYLEQKRLYGKVPGFYLDCALWFLDLGERATAARIASNMVELGYDDPGLIRMTAGFYRSLGDWDRAAALLERLALLRPELPQASRDLALTLAARGADNEAKGNSEAANTDYRAGMELLAKAVLEPWGRVTDPLKLAYLLDDRFQNFEQVALMDYHHLRQRSSQPLNLTRGEEEELENQLKFEARADLRVVVNWDQDDTDVDLWVIEPGGEKVFYKNTHSKSGGLMFDNTGGLGPEPYIVKEAMPGTYRIQLHFFGDDRAAQLGPVTATVELYTDFGGPEERMELRHVRLTKKDEIQEVGLLTFD